MHNREKVNRGGTADRRIRSNAKDGRELHTRQNARRGY